MRETKSQSLEERIRSGRQRVGVSEQIESPREVMKRVSVRVGKQIEDIFSERRKAKSSK